VNARTRGRSAGLAVVVAAVEALERRQLFAVDVTIDAAETFQTIDGFGTMATPYSPAKAELLYRDFGASIVRTAVDVAVLRAPGDTQWRVPTKPVELGPDLEQNLKKFDFATPRSTAMFDTVRASKSLASGRVKWLASLWTPPHWMKGPEVDSGTGKVRDADAATPGVQPVQPTLNYYGNDSSGGSLTDTPENITQFARYVAAYVVGAGRAAGVPVYGISIQNEPVFHEPYDSCVYTPATYVKAVKAVAAEFRANGIRTKVVGPEDVGVGPTSDPWILKRQYDYINAIRADPQAMAAVDVYAIHGYANDGVTPNRSPTNWGQYWNGRGKPAFPSWTGIKQDGKRSWMTETSGETPDWAGAMRIALNEQDALVQGNVSAWVYWEMENKLTTQHKGALTAKSDPTAPKYVAAKHFAKYVRPGAVRVAATPSDPTGVYASAYVNDSAKTLTSVLINASNKSQKVRLTLKDVGVNAFTVDRRSDAKALWVDRGPVAVRNRTATLTLSPQSVVTLQGSTAPEKMTGRVIGTGGSLNNAGNTRRKALDGKSKTFFQGPRPDGAWVGLDLGSAKQLRQIRYTARRGHDGRMVGGTFQASDTRDFSANVVDVHMITARPGHRPKTVTVDLPGTFRYVRYLGPAGSFGTIADVEFRG